MRTHPAGGTEAAIVHTAEALAGLGPEVDVWSNCKADLYFEGVRYRPNQNAFDAIAKEQYDAFIVVRHLAALSIPVRARTVAYWTHDNTGQPFTHGAVRWQTGGKGDMLTALGLGDCLRAGAVDLVFAVSQWQANAQAELYGIDPATFHVIGNGLSIAARKLLGVREHKRPYILHTLPPDRALLELIEMFPAIKQRVPRAELHAYSRSTIYGVEDDQDIAKFGHLYDALGRMRGARHFDPVDPRSLYSFLRRASVWAYPTTVAETYSISTLEAQAGGAVPVVSAVGALPERIEHGVDGFLVPGDPDEEVVRAEFVDYISKLLLDDELRERMSDAARARALAPNASYSAVAARMLSTLETSLADREFEERGFDLNALGWPLTSRTYAGEERMEVKRDHFERLLRGVADRLKL